MRKHHLTAFIFIVLTLFASKTILAIPSFINNEPLPSLAPVLEKVTPAVVNIATKSFIQQRENPLLQDPFFRQFFQLPSQTQKRTSQSLGSGVIIDANRGYILTNHHVIDKADEITVTLTDGRHFSANIVGSDPESDVAVIQIKATKLVALNIADSEQLRVGDFVVAIGNPFGLGQTVTSGIISALGRTGLGIEGYEDFIQTDASINPGNSGGALINLRGELIGINTAIIAPSGGNVGIGFAIPSNMAVSLKEQLVKFGRIQRGQIGINVQDLTPELVQAFNLPRHQGVIISKVQTNSSAYDAGLRSGDIVLSINQREIKSSARLRNILGLLSIGDTAKIDILRNTQHQSVILKIRKKTIHYVEGAKIHAQLAGATLSNIPDQKNQNSSIAGVFVDEVVNGSRAWQSGLRKGDIIAMANRLAINDTADLTQATQGKKTLLLNIQRDNSAFFLLIR